MSLAGECSGKDTTLMKPHDEQFQNLATKLLLSFLLCLCACVRVRVSVWCVKEPAIRFDSTVSK